MGFLFCRLGSCWAPCVSGAGFFSWDLGGRAPVPGIIGRGATGCGGIRMIKEAPWLVRSLGRTVTRWAKFGIGVL